MLKEYVGLDVTKMYSASAPADKELADRWTWDFFLQAAEKCHKAGHPFGLAVSQCSDSVNWVGSVFAAYSAELVNAKGEITVKSDATRQVLEWFKKLVPLMPESVFAWDNASNNKALVSGQSAFIFNPPSAWAVAKRDAPKVAEQLWTFPSPKGPKGRFDTDQFRFLGDLEVLQKQDGGKEPADASLDPRPRADPGRGKPGLRHPALREVARFQDLGRGRSAKGHDLQLPAARRRQAEPLGVPGPSEYRRADLCPGDDVQDDRQMYPGGPIDRCGNRLCRLGD